MVDRTTPQPAPQKPAWEIPVLEDAATAIRAGDFDGVWPDSRITFRAGYVDRTPPAAAEAAAAQAAAQPPQRPLCRADAVPRARLSDDRPFDLGSMPPAAMTSLAGRSAAAASEVRRSRRRLRHLHLPRRPPRRRGRSACTDSRLRGSARSGLRARRRPHRPSLMSTPRRRPRRRSPRRCPVCHSCRLRPSRRLTLPPAAAAAAQAPAPAQAPVRTPGAAGPFAGLPAPTVPTAAARPPSRPARTPRRADSMRADSVIATATSSALSSRCWFRRLRPARHRELDSMPLFPQNRPGRLRPVTGASLWSAGDVEKAIRAS